MSQIEIICLANSIKHGGRCVAGLRTDGQGWLRPVSNKEDGALAYYHYRYSDSTPAQTLDVMRVGVIRPRPLAFQPENWLIDSKPWELVARPLAAAQLSILRNAIIRGPLLLHSETDRVPPALAAGSSAPHSLELIAPRSIEMYPISGRADQPRTRARFTLGDARHAVKYDLSLTDPHWREAALRMGNITIEQAETPFVATVSLSEPFEGNCFKLLAAVIRLPPGMNVE